MVKFFKRNCHNSTTTCNTFGNDFWGTGAKTPKNWAKSTGGELCLLRGIQGGMNSHQLIPLARTFREILVLGGVGLNKWSCWIQKWKEHDERKKCQLSTFQPRQEITMGVVVNIWALAEVYRCPWSNLLFKTKIVVCFVAGSHRESLLNKCAFPSYSP